MSKQQQPTNAYVHGSIASYTIGFLLALVLTLGAYLLVTYQVFSGWMLIGAIMGLALVQFLVQLIFFLHLGRENGPKWNFLAFTFMIGVVVIIVGGSLWIMGNLNYNMMSPEQMNTYMQQQNEKGF